MPYDHSLPLKSGEFFVSYPEHYKEYAKNEVKFKNYLFAYLKTNECTCIPVGVTEDLRLVCRMNPNNTIQMVNERRDYLKASKSKAKKGGKKKK